MKILRNPWIVLTLLLCSSFTAVTGRADSQTHGHLVLDLLPIAQGPNTAVGGGAGLSYDRYFDALKSSYFLGFEGMKSYAGRVGLRGYDLVASAGFTTEVTRAFSIGARLGVVVDHPGGAVGTGAIALRLPALSPENKEPLSFSFFYEEIDLGLLGAGERYAAFRLGMLLF